MKTPLLISAVAGSLVGQGLGGLMMLKRRRRA